MKPIYSIIDIETTGGRALGNKITEIAIINTDGEEILEEYSTLINPEQRIPTSITRLTGITNEMVEDAPKFYEVAKKIVEMTEGNIFVAHNVYFDFNFIKAEFSELGYSFQREKTCTVRLARKLLPGHKSYSLGEICNDLNIQISARHRALGDALATFELFKILNKTGEITIDFDQRNLALPQHLKREVLNSLPELPGVYYFYSIDGELLYIGKSKNIRKRVFSHMRADLKRRRDIELKDKIAHIETKITGHELAALILEAHEIKSYRPIYNRALKKVKFPYGLYLHRGKVFELRITTLKDLPDCPYQFGSKKAAEAKKNSFYKSLLGVEADSLFFKHTLDNYLDKLGAEVFNQMLEKVFFSSFPKYQNYILELNHQQNKRMKTVVYIENQFPTRIDILENNEINQSIDIMEHAEIKSILINYINKYNIKPIKWF